jgi:predicted nucleic acid-binding protein
MSILFLDANIIVRHVTKDSTALSKKARNILRQVEAGSLEVTTSETVLAECVFVLSSKTLYNFSRDDIKTVLLTILSFKGLKLPHKQMYRNAIDIYASSNIDFIDAVAVAHMRRLNIKTILSFDRHFDTIAGIVRKEA